MADYRVNLDIFAGPLDLLLYLVRKEEVDIYDIPLAKVTDQYLHYVDMLKQFDMDLAGDFLVMAATLMEIKSAMLLPKTNPEEVDGEDPTDPRAELIRQLLEYKKFKDAANLLNAAAEQQKERHSRPTNLIDRLAPKAEPEIDMDQVSVWDLLEAFDTVCKATGHAGYTGHIKDDTPIDLYEIEILHRLQTEGPTTFERIFEGRPNRLVMVGLFLAMLELIRDRLIWVEQSQDASRQIYLRALTEEPAESAVRKTILDFDTMDSATDEIPETTAEPPIPIAELPPQSRPATERRAETPRNEESAPPHEQGDEANETSPETLKRPPIPIVEAPARSKPKAPQPSEPRPDESDSAATDDDLTFDNP